MTKLTHHGAITGITYTPTTKRRTGRSGAAGGFTWPARDSKCTVTCGKRLKFIVRDVAELAINSLVKPSARIRLAKRTVSAAAAAAPQWTGQPPSAAMFSVTCCPVDMMRDISMDASLLFKIQLLVVDEGGSSGDTPPAGWRTLGIDSTPTTPDTVAEALWSAVVLANSGCTMRRR